MEIYVYPGMLVLVCVALRNSYMHVVRQPLTLFACLTYQVELAVMH